MSAEKHSAPLHHDPQPAPVSFRAGPARQNRVHLNARRAPEESTLPRRQARIPLPGPPRREPAPRSVRFRCKCLPRGMAGHCALRPLLRRTAVGARCAARIRVSAALWLSKGLGASGAGFLGGPADIFATAVTVHRAPLGMTVHARTEVKREAPRCSPLPLPGEGQRGVSAGAVSADRHARGEGPSGARRSSSPSPGCSGAGCVAAAAPGPSAGGLDRHAPTRAPTRQIRATPSATGARPSPSASLASLLRPPYTSPATEPRPKERFDPHPGVEPTSRMDA
jgi:hypothetical protein